MAFNRSEVPVNLENRVGLRNGDQFCLSEVAADVHFVFESGDRIPAHKIVLADSSDVFNAMFFGPLMEKADVEIVDAPAALFRKFLQFFYLKTVHITMENVYDLVTLAEKYNVSCCLDVCETFLLLNVSVDNVCGIYGLGVILNRGKMIEFCEGVICENRNSVFQTEGFLCCDRQMLALILKLDGLSCLEVQVFEACMNWLERSSNTTELTRQVVENHLGNLLYDIRFVSISKEQFDSLLNSYAHIFTQDDINEISALQASNDYQPKHFNKLPRRIKWNEEKTVICNRIKEWIPSPQHNLANVERIIFTTNKTLLLGFFRCTPILTQRRKIIGRDVPMKVEISRHGNDSELQPHPVLYNGQISLGLEESTHKLSEPIILLSGSQYEIRLRAVSRGRYASFFKMNGQVQIEPDIIVNFHGDRMYNGNATSVIFELGFNRFY